MHTTLNKIRIFGPCQEGWKKLLKSLGKTKVDDEPLPLMHILESNGIRDAAWALRCVEGRDKEIRLFSCDCACSTLHLFESVHPTDMRPRMAIEAAVMYAYGDMLKASPAALLYNEEAEEWAIHDSESLGSISKSESFASIVDLAQAINEHGDAALVYIENHGNFNKEHFEESYVGNWDSFKEYAEELAEELISCESGKSEFLVRYFDYESFARDLEMDYWHELAQGGGVHVFRYV